jgi:threonine/homoserine/homoserine lactone efflux protein
MEYLLYLGIGFLVGLTGAVAPGPMLIATIEGSLKEGLSAGPKAVLGHGTIEIGIFVLIVFGLYTLVDRWIHVVGIIGGTIMIIFGFTMLKKTYVENKTTFGNMVIAGALTSALNPYFWIWWLTAGFAMLSLGLPSLYGATILMVGHLVADFGWYGGISLMVAKTRRFLRYDIYTLVLRGCGAFLIIFGLWFVFGNLGGFV